MWWWIIGLLVLGSILGVVFWLVTDLYDEPDGEDELPRGS